MIVAEGSAGTSRVPGMMNGASYATSAAIGTPDHAARSASAAPDECPYTNAPDPDPPSRRDDGGEIGHLAVGGVGRGVTAAAAAAPVPGHHGEPGREVGGRHERLPVAERPERDDERRTLPGPVVAR